MVAGMTRRQALVTMLAAAGATRLPAAGPAVRTVAGTGVPGCSDILIDNPYGLAFGRDGALYFCDLGNQRIRRLDLDSRTISVVAGNGTRAYAGDGGPATAGSLDMPHEIQFDAAGHLYIAERDSHVVRRVDARSGTLETFAGTGAPGFGGDGGAATRASLRQPHSIAVDRDRNRLLVCDTGNHRLRAIDLGTGIIETIGGTGERRPTPDGAVLAGTPLDGPRAIAFDGAGQFYLALREGNAIYRVDPAAGRLRHIAGTGAQGYSGDGGSARAARLAGPKGLAWAAGALYVADTENHAIRRIHLRSGVITTVLGTGRPGDGPSGDPLRCSLNRPHGVLADGRGRLFVADSEAHRIRLLA
jgi:sugar lactone lactonase YvrE